MTSGLGQVAVAAVVASAPVISEDFLAHSTQLQKIEVRDQTVYKDADPEAEFADIPQSIIDHSDKRADAYDEGSEKVSWLSPLFSQNAFQRYFEKHPFTTQSDAITHVSVGSGNGFSSKTYDTYLEEQGFKTETYGIDISSGMLAEGQKSGRLDHGIQASGIDGLRFFPENSVDLIDFVGASEYSSLGQIRTYATHAFRATKPGGVAIMSYEIEGSNTPKQPNNQHNTEALCTLFKDAGWSIFEQPRGYYQAWNVGKDKRPISNGILTAYSPK